MAHDLAPLAGLWRASPFRRGAAGGPLERLGIKNRMADGPDDPALGGDRRGLLQRDRLHAARPRPPGRARGNGRNDLPGPFQRPAGELLATDLSDAEIVLGKLGARLVPVVGLVACALPPLAICVLMGGVDPLALAGAFLITVCLGIFGCALALAFSLWAARPYEAILATYAFFIVWLLAIPTWDNIGRHWGFPTSPDWLIWSHPFCLAVAPYVQPGKVGALDYLAFGAAMLISSSALLALVIGRMRAVIAAEGARSASRLAARRPGHFDSQPENWQPERSDARSEPRALV